MIDYRAQRFEDAVADMDLVLDTVGGDTWERSWDVLRPGGRLVSIAVPRPPDRETVDGRRAIWFVVEPDRAQLIEIGGLIDGGQVRPIVSAVVPLARGTRGVRAEPPQWRAGQGRAARCGVAETDRDTPTARGGRRHGEVWVHREVVANALTTHAKRICEVLMAMDDVQAA